MKLHLPVSLRKSLLFCIAGIMSCASAANLDYVLSGGSGTADSLGSKGGAIYKQYGSITLSGYGSLRLLNNEVTQMGGAMCATQSTGNSEYINGHLITYVTQNSVTLTNIDNINISRNKAGKYGEDIYGSKRDGVAGAIYGNTTISGCGTVAFKNNKAPGTAGAIYGTLDASNSDAICFASNTTGNYGGAVCGSVNISEVNTITFDGNRADSRGGAIYGAVSISFANEAVLFRSNRSKGDGGAIYTSGYASFSDNQEVQFVNNEADGRGGAVRAANMDIIYNGKVLVEGNKQDDESAALDVTGSLWIENNNEVVLRDNGRSISAGTLYLSAGFELDSKVEIYDAWRVGTAYFNRSSEADLVFSGDECIGDISGSATLHGGLMTLTDGATLSIGNSFTIQSASILNCTQEFSTALTVGGNMAFQGDGQVVFVLDIPISSTIPVIEVNSASFMCSSLHADVSSMADGFAGMQALMKVSDSFSYDDNEYYYSSGSWWMNNGTKVSDINSVMPVTSSSNSGIRWVDNTLYYISSEEGQEWSFKTKGLETAKTWRGTTMDWYDVNKTVVFEQPDIQLDEKLKNTEEEYWCWVATAANMIQYWQDRYAPLYTGDNLVTAKSDNRNYRGVHLELIKSMSSSDKRGDDPCTALEYWMLGTDSNHHFTKVRDSGWKALGVSDDDIQDVSFVEETAVKDVYRLTSNTSPEYVRDILKKWEKESYSPIALSYHCGPSLEYLDQGHVMTLWRAECRGDEVILYLTDSDYDVGRMETFVTKFVDGSWLVISDSVKKADENYYMPYPLWGKIDRPSIYVITGLCFLGTPSGLEEMLEDYNSNKTFFWSGAAKDGEWKHSTKMNGSEYHLASAEDGWKKECSGGGRTIYANAYFTQEETPYSSFVFADSLNNSAIRNKTVKLSSNLEVANILVSGFNYELTGSGVLKSESMTVSGGLIIDGNVRLRDTYLAVSGCLETQNFASEIPAIEQCNVFLDGGQLWCSAMNLTESESGSLTIGGRKYDIDAINLQMKNCIIDGRGVLGVTLDFGRHNSELFLLSDIYGSDEELIFYNELYASLTANNKVEGKYEDYSFNLTIRGANISGNADLIADRKMFISGSTLQITQTQSKAQTLTIGSSSSSRADVAMCEINGGEIISEKSILMTLAGETTYFNQATSINAPKLLVGEDGKLVNDGNLGGIDLISVEYGATLAGSGMFGKTVVNEYGSLIVGNSPGAPVYETLEMAANSGLLFYLDGCTPASASENGWGSGTHSLLTVTQSNGLELETGTIVRVGCSLDFLNSVALAEEQTLTLVQLSAPADSALLAALQAGTQFKLANPDDSLEDLSLVGALVHSSSWAQGANNTLTLSFTVSSCPENALIWTNATGDGAWNSTSENWKQLDGTAASFAADKNVLVTGGGTINVAENLSIGKVVVSVRDSLSLTGNGSLGGTGSLVKEGSGELIVDVSNTYTGGTEINGGKLKVTHAEALGTGVVNLESGELEICVDGVDNQLRNFGESTLTIAAGEEYILTDKIFNAGELTISGVLNADMLSLSENVEASQVDIDGKIGVHGFACDAGSKVWVVNNEGTLNVAAAIVRKDNKDYILGNDGVARYGMEVHYNEYLVGERHDVSVSDIVRVAADHNVHQTDIRLQGGTLDADAVVTGSLTLGGGSLELASGLTVQGSLIFEAGKQTNIDLSEWTAAAEGDVLITFANCSDYDEDALTLSGIDGYWRVYYDSAACTLSLAPLQDRFIPSLSRNQHSAYQAVQGIKAAGNPDGVLGERVKEILGARDESALKRALDEVSGREYAGIMNSQMEGNLGHMRRLRAAAGKGNPLGNYLCASISNSSDKESSVMVPETVIDSRRIRAGVAAFHEESELDADSNGDGFDRSESGAQLLVEYLISDKLAFGMGISQSRTRLTPSYGKRRDEDNTHFDLYGVYQSGRWSSTTALGLGLHQYELDRTIGVMSTDAETDGFSVNFLQDVAYTVWSDEQHGVQVFGSVESSFNIIDAFSEGGAGNASLLVDEQEAWATDMTLGMRYNRTLPALGKALPGTLTLQAGVVASLGERSHDVSMRFAGAAAHGYKQCAAERSLWGYNVGVSVNLPVTAETALYGSAEAVIRNASTSVDAQVGVKISF